MFDTHKTYETPYTNRFDRQLQNSYYWLSFGFLELLWSSLSKRLWASVLPFFPMLKSASSSAFSRSNSLFRFFSASRFRAAVACWGVWRGGWGWLICWWYWTCWGWWSNCWVWAGAAAARTSCCNGVPPGGCAGWLATPPSDEYITLNKALFSIFKTK